MSRQLAALRLWQKTRRDRFDDARVEEGQAARQLTEEQQRMEQLQQFRASCTPRTGTLVNGLSLQTANMFASQMDQVIHWQQQQVQHHEHNHQAKQQQMIRCQREAKQSDGLVEKRLHLLQVAALRREQRQGDEMAQLMFQARARDSEELSDMS
ncbi:flagellar FliJ family protein [Endozoicomonadaceae bacterium StTr2]